MGRAEFNLKIKVSLPPVTLSKAYPLIGINLPNGNSIKELKVYSLPPSFK